MHHQLRHRLVRQLSDARARNPNFSLRSMAKMIGINHSALSELIHGKRRISPKKAAAIATRLGLASDEIEEIAKEAGSSKKSLSNCSNRQATTISLDKFETISGWLPFALLSLMETDDYVSDIAWMAKRMGVPKRTIQSTLNRLVRVGLAIHDEDGSYRAIGGSFATPEFIASEAMKLHHLQNLELARQALDNMPVESRYFSSMTMAIDPARLDEAKMILQKFRDEFCQKIETPPKREVYRLVLQFFPISKG